MNSNKNTNKYNTKKEYQSPNQILLNSNPKNIKFLTNIVKDCYYNYFDNIFCIFNSINDILCLIYLIQ